MLYNSKIIFFLVNTVQNEVLRLICWCYLWTQVLWEALKISSPPALISMEVPRFHSGSLWHSTLV